MEASRAVASVVVAHFCLYFSLLHPFSTSGRHSAVAVSEKSLRAINNVGAVMECNQTPFRSSYRSRLTTSVKQMLHNNDVLNP